MTEALDEVLGAEHGGKLDGIRGVTKLEEVVSAFTSGRLVLLVQEGALLVFKVVIDMGRHLLGITIDRLHNPRCLSDWLHL